MLTLSNTSSSHPPVMNPPVMSGSTVGFTVGTKTLKLAILEELPNIPNAIGDLIASYVPKQEGVFGECDWNELCGRVTPAPPLPSDIEKIWEGPCPIFPNKSVKETHLLVYLPTTVDNKPLTVITLGEIARQQNEIDYNVWDFFVEKEGDKPVKTSCWVLMTKTVIGNSKSYMYSNLPRMKRCSYITPTVLEASICILTHYMRTGIRLFSDNPHTYTRCDETTFPYVVDFDNAKLSDIYQLAVGNFSANRLVVTNLSLDDNWCGNADLSLVAPLWKL